MKINAVAVSSTNFRKTIRFYSLLGFKFPEVKGDEQHIEPIVTDGSVRLMVDSVELMTKLLGEEPKPGNHSSFAILFDSPEEINEVAMKIKNAEFTIVKEPWDAFWGQRYCVVEDPDGYRVDLFSSLSKK